MKLLRCVVDVYSTFTKNKIYKGKEINFGRHYMINNEGISIAMWTDSDFKIIKISDKITKVLYDV